VSDRTFFSEYMLLNAGTEIPATFSMWCGLSAVSAVLGRRVYLDMGPFSVFPNMYIVLIAGSGRMRKSTAVGVTKKLLSDLDPQPNLISQKLTPEYLLQKLRNGAESTIKIGSKMGQVGQGYLVTDELTNFLNPTTVQSGINAMLTDLYDCTPRFSYGTVGRGEELLVDTQMGILAATTPEELHKAIPKEGIGSGLASRVIFVYNDTPNPPVAFPTYSDRQISAKEYCIRFLQRCYTISGKVDLAGGAREWCVECYNERCYKSPLYDDPHLRGYASRRFIHVLKLATVISVGLMENLTITIDSLERAEQLLALNEVNLPKIVQLVTMNEKGSLTHLVLGLITRHKKISREALMKETWHYLDSNELTAVIETLIRSNQVCTQSNGSNIYYILRE
jgi:hypothetical protein